MWALIALAGLLGTSFALPAQNPEMAFEDGCSRQLPEELRPLVIKKLGEFEAALSEGDLDGARTAQREAEGATQDVAGWSGALAIKCLGDQQLYRRYFIASQQLWDLQAKQNQADIASRVRAALWTSVLAEDSAETILAGVPDDYRGHGIARDYLNRAAESVTIHRDSGAFVISEETATERQARQAIELIDARAAQRIREALTREVRAFTRDPTEFEKQGAQTLEGFGQLASSMAGMEMNTAEQAEYQLARQRIRESFDELNTARGWAFETGSPVADERARERGDEVIAWANRDDLSFTTRDEYYDRAQAYYEWCRCTAAAASAAAAREAIQPQLAAERARRQAQADEARRRLEGQAENLQRALDDMQKTDAEKKAFDEEADALEAELGF